jgi:hypothetical protein
MNNRTVLQMLCFLIAGTCSQIAFSGEDSLFENIDPAVSYSAWRIVETQDGRMKIREYHAPNKKRFEMNAQGHDMVMIIRMDKGESWTLIPEAKIYMQTSAANVNQSTGGDFKVLEQTAMGKEQVNGFASTKFKGTFVDPQGHKVSGYFWLTEKHGIPIKTDIIRQTATGKERTYTELTGLELGSQSPSLFEVPDSYRAMPGSMGGMFGNPSGAQSMPNQRHIQQLMEERQAQLANEGEARRSGEKQEKAALSQLTVDYLSRGCWFYRDEQTRFNPDGSFEEGTLAGSGYAMHKGGDSIEEFSREYDGLVSKTQNRFVVRAHGRQFALKRGTCVAASHSVAGGGIQPDQNLVHKDAKDSAEKNVVDKAADKIKKGFRSLFH